MTPSIWARRYTNIFTVSTSPSPTNPHPLAFEVTYERTRDFLFHLSVVTVHGRVCYRLDEKVFRVQVFSRASSRYSGQTSLR